MSDEWYVRIRGEVRGPVSEAELQSQIRKKRIGRHHEISEDAVHWQRAGDVEGLFEPVISVMQPAASSQSAPEMSPAAPQRSPAPAPVPQERTALPKETEWFYAQDGSRNGPVPESQLISVISSGQLMPTDLVWCDKFEAWTPLMQVPRLAAALPGQVSLVQREATAVRPSAASTQLLPSSLFAMLFACISLLAAPLNAFIAALIAGNPAFAPNNVGAGILATLVMVAVFGAMPLFAAVTGILTGHESLRFHRANPTAYGGAGYALTALILCYGVVVITWIVVLVLLIVAGVKSA
ncbi:MAG: hypothetical protein RL215_1630 [Planctomycetota bacterium]